MREQWEDKGTPGRGMSIYKGCEVGGSVAAAERVKGRVLGGEVRWGLVDLMGPLLLP